MLPAQMVELLAAVGAPGIGLIVTLTVPAALVHPFTVCVTEYKPAARVVAPTMVGFCRLEVKVFGPVQLYEFAPFGSAVRFRFDPAHNDELLPALGAAGVGLTVTPNTDPELPQPDTFTEQV